MASPYVGVVPQGDRAPEEGARGCAAHERLSGLAQPTSTTEHRGQKRESLHFSDDGRNSPEALVFEVGEQLNGRMGTGKASRFCTESIQCRLDRSRREGPLAQRLEQRTHNAISGLAGIPVVLEGAEFTGVLRLERYCRSPIASRDSDKDSYSAFGVALAIESSYDSG
jgi:hypothetical protein